MNIRHIMFFVATACAVETGLTADGTWSASSGGNWSETGNWQDGAVASGSGSTAYIDSGTGTITNDQTGLVLTGVQFTGGNYTLAGDTITLAAAGFIAVLGGTQTVDAAVALQGGMALRASADQILSVAGPVSGAGGITVNGGSVKLSNSANAYTGQTVLQTGLLEVASVQALGSGTDPIMLGKGTFRFSAGAPEELAQGYTVNSGGGNANTVLDIQTNLTVSGKVDVSGSQGRVIKAGPGTLTYTYSGYQIMNRGGSGTTADATLVLDTLNGGAGTQGFQDFTLAEGKIVFNTPGQTNRFIGHMLIGARYPAAAHMEVSDGVVQNPDTWLSISRGNGDSTTPYSSSLTLTGGRMELRGLVMGYGAGMPNFASYPVLDISGGEMTISGDSYIGETSGAQPTVNMTGGRLVSDGTGYGFALNVWNTSSLIATMNISGSAKADLAKLYFRNNATLSVTGGGTLGLRSTAASNPGTAVFDNGTLTTYAPSGQPSEWFHGTPKLYVRSGGLTADVPADEYAVLASTPLADPASPGGQITKTGDGTFALYNAEMPIQVSAGTLRLMGAHLSTNKIAKTISLAAGSALELAAPHAAEADTVSVSGDTEVVLTVPDWAARTELWKINGSAISRTDGVLELAQASGAGAGSVFMTRRISVTNVWQATFSVSAMAGRAFNYQGDGVAFVIQNDTRGASAYSTNLVSGSFGYAGGAAPVAHSFAAALDLTNRRLCFGTNGVFMSQTYDLSLLPDLGADMKKTFFSISYDGAGTVTCTLTRNGLQTRPYTFAADLQALTGGTHAYVGFTAGNTSSRYEEHLVRDVTFTAGTSSSVKAFCQYGGSVALTGGQTLDVTLSPAPAQNGFGLGQLAYADGSVLDVSQPAFTPTPSPDLNDADMWQLNGKAFWVSPGHLAVSSNYTYSSGAAYTTNLYPVTGSWTARFNYDIGEMTSTPADYITFVIQHSSPSSTSHTPSPGFAIMWRYYSGGPKDLLNMYTNGIEVAGSDDTSPVSLPTGGPAVMTITHDATAKTVTVITEQTAGAYTNVFEGVDMAAAVNSANAYLGFGAFTGGLYAQNIVSDFSFTQEDAAPDTAWHRSYFTVGAASGSGTLVKKGSAALGIQDGSDNPFTNATVRLDEGGLVLRKLACEPVTLGDDFYLSPWASWAPGGALQTMYVIRNSAGNAVTAKRHVVTQPWTARFTFFVGARNGAADGFSFFVHNDPRGPSALGGAYSGAGYSGIANSAGLEWNYYEGDSKSNTVVLCKNGSWSGERRSNLPIKITTINEETDMTIRYDPDAKTLGLTMAQGTNTFSTTFTGMDISACVGGDLAYIGFGSGCGGQQCETRVKDFSFTLDTPTNPLPAAACLGTAMLPAGTTNIVSLDTVVSDAEFVIGTVQVGDGATLGLESVQSDGGTLTVSQTALSGNAVFDVHTAAALALTDLSGGATITKRGAGILRLEGAAATYADDTVLEAGTLAFDAARLPMATDLYVTSGAMLNLAFTGKQYIHSLYVDGEAMNGGVYTAANTTWIAGPGKLVVTYPPVGTLLYLR